MDLNETTLRPLYSTIRRWRNSNFFMAGQPNILNYCPFIESGSTAVSWDGGLSPCLPLMHSHTSYLHDKKRFSRKCVIGNVHDAGISYLWHSPGYVGLRERIQAFDFPPCVHCGGCNFSTENNEDCFGNIFPTCGGCLWAQGIIRCP